MSLEGVKGVAKTAVALERVVTQHALDVSGELEVLLAAPRAAVGRRAPNAD